MVESRCAIVMVVRFCLAMSSSSAACTMRSLSLSSALVASSSSSSAGSRTSALASAMRCFCPPEREAPAAPIRVSKPLGSAAMKSNAFASRAASSTASIEQSASPYAMLSRMVMLGKSGGSCCTHAVRRRRSASPIRATSAPSSRTRPDEGT
mmetsp:Transcript_26391/g.84913  ORF Transcript_26391/g.84913 Transcript_26391/m.84913 type:complete len:152 (+) Transcript_26391:360-815(+)